MREEARDRQSANSRYLKDVLLRLLGRCGLMLFYFRVRERLISLRGGAAAVTWCRKYLPFVEASVNQPTPPLIYQDESFDLIYAFSVLTHLPIKSQIAWRDEFARVLRPGGRLLLSLHGDAYLESLSPE